MPRPHAIPIAAMLALATCVAALLGAPGCGSDPARPVAPTPGNVSLEAANREVASIGASGGTVSTTSASGVSYVLDIPAGALPGDVEIALTPVTSIRTIPFPGEVLAAVDLEPSGLILLKPALLTIGTPAIMTGSQVLTGFSYEGEATSFEPSGAIATGGTMQVLVGHFSGAGAARGEADDVSEWVDQACERPTLRASVGWQLTVCIGVYPENGARFIQFASDYLDEIVTPALNGAMDLTLVDAVIEYLEWYWTCDYVAAGFGSTDWETVLAARIAAADVLAAQKLRDAITAQKAALCASGADLEQLRILCEYRNLADALGLGDEPGLGEDDLLAGLCAVVDIEDVSLIEPLPVGSDHSLDARADLEINGQRVNAVFQFLVTASDNIRCGGGLPACGGRSNEAGEFATVLRRSSQDPGVINVNARLLLPLFQRGGEQGQGGFALVETPLAGFRLLLRSGGAIAVAFPASIAVNEPATLSLQVTEAEVVGPASPVPFAVLTFTADGATVNPAQTIADQDGRAEVTVTAQDGARTVTVTITAAVDGVVIASKQVEAEAAGSSGATVRLDTRASIVQANALDNCVENVFDLKDSNETGFVILVAAAEGNCQEGGEQAHTEVSVTLATDPGVAADNRSATITFDSSSSSSMQRREVAFAGASAYAELYAAFEIEGGAMNYAVAASASTSGASTEGTFYVQIIRANEGYYWEKQTGDGTPMNVSAMGMLSPGRFQVRISYEGGAWSDDYGTFTGTLGLNATVTLTPAAGAGSVPARTAVR